MVKHLPARPGAAGDSVSIPGSERSPGENGNPHQYSCLKNPMDRGKWLRPKWLLFCQESHAIFLPPGNPLLLPHLLTKWLRHESEGNEEIQKTSILVEVPWRRKEPFAVMSLEEMELS